MSILTGTFFHLTVQLNTQPWNCHWFQYHRKIGIPDFCIINNSTLDAIYLFLMFMQGRFTFPNAYANMYFLIKDIFYIPQTITSLSCRPKNYLLIFSQLFFETEDTSMRSDVLDWNFVFLSFVWFFTAQLAQGSITAQCKLTVLLTFLLMAYVFPRIDFLRIIVNCQVIFNTCGFFVASFLLKSYTVCTIEM